MEKTTVAVEEGLAPIKKYLQMKGYLVVDLRPGQKADAAVVRSIDINMSEIRAVVAEGPVIAASYLHPELIAEQIKMRVH